MKKAVIAVGSKQYLVTEADTLNIELNKTGKDKLSFEPLLVIDGDNVAVGQPTLDKYTVNADVVNQEIKADKVVAIRYKAKKRVHKIHGHRQRYSTIKISSIKSK